MHPNVFLKTFWQMEVKPQVFVAMSFHKSCDERFRQVMQPAIEGIVVNGVTLTAYRVDNSKTGDSILTDIMDGVAHSQLVLADLSTMGRDPETGYAYRNGNVMYEVGLALACRQPCDVLLVRDDNDSFLFDVSTIPHLTLDFANPAAWSILQAKLIERLREQRFVNDARVQMALANVSQGELLALRQAAEYPPGVVWGRPNTGSVDVFDLASTPRLLDKQLIRLRGTFEGGYPGYECTPLGRIVALLAKSGLPQLKADMKEEPKVEEPMLPQEASDPATPQVEGT